MTGSEKFGHPYQESAVAPRFSFADAQRARDDVTVKDGLIPRRLITYPAPPAPQTALRETLAEAGLILGEPVATGGSVVQFSVPYSARPLSHEARVDSVGSFAYGDEDLFYDLGRMLGKLAEASSEEPYYLTGVGDNVALVEFTRVDEPKLLFVPGFELGVATAEDDDQVLAIYGQTMHDEFGDQFAKHHGQFMDGFRSVLE